MGECMMSCDFRLLPLHNRLGHLRSGLGSFCCLLWGHLLMGQHDSTKSPAPQKTYIRIKTKIECQLAAHMGPATRNGLH